ncbi:hypothetical protein DIPPA_09325 [Diplonema papillatum]|nr:hypothetical protein DIPPA_09325 [Diplonema papillatum]
MRALDETVEMNEFRDLCKDLGLFPRQVSYADISKLTQLACFGVVKTNPGDSVPDAKSAHVLVPSPKRNPTTRKRVVLEQETCDNPPDECEVLLNQAQFNESLLRLAQLLDTNAQFPSIASRMEALLHSMNPLYRELFRKKMTDDCDWALKGVPLLKNTTDRAALSPLRGSCHGGYYIYIEGSNFCTKRPVVVRFSDTAFSNVITVPAFAVKNRRISVVAPQVSVYDVEVDVEVEAESSTYCIWMTRIARYSIECSNDKHEFSKTTPKQIYTFEEEHPVWYLDDVTKLHKVFAKVVSYRDRRNTRFLTADKWRMFKADYGIEENPTVPQLPILNSEDGKTSDIPFFKELEQLQALPPQAQRDGDSALGSRNEGCLEFKSFVKLLCKCYALYRCGDETKFEATRPQQRIDALADVAAQQEEKKFATVIVDDILPDIAIGREQIALIERRTSRQLDVYCGSVLCASISSRPGYVQCVRGTKTPHRAFSCVVHDTNNNSSLLQHTESADSFDHLYHRLASAGFHFASSADPATRKPAGRCWEVFNDAVRVGALWDYRGNFSNHIWQPTALDAYSPVCTMTVYREHDHIDYIVCFMQFAKAETIARMRELLTQRGYSLKTCMYRKV